jgi:hypothetical protein
MSATLAIGASCPGLASLRGDQGNYASDRLHPMYDVARDDQRFLMLQRKGESELQLAVVPDWAKSIRARLGASK